MCGEPLPERVRRPNIQAVPAASIPPSAPAKRMPEDEKWVEAPVSDANPVGTAAPSRALVDSLAVKRSRDEEPIREERETRARDLRDESSSVSSSPSFLGLGNADHEPPQREISWRFWALLLVLLGIIALFGLQWRANRLRAAEQSKPQSGVAQPGPQASPSDDLSGNGQPKSDSAAKPEDKSAQPSSAQPTTDDKNPAPATPDVKAKPKHETKAEASDAASDANRDGAASSTEAASADSARDFSDTPVKQADSLIAGGDCNGAVRVLRGAGDNPRAMTKLGAMYLTGTCVDADRVTAYAWFSQAFSADPHNLRLESTRRMVWSQMSSDERAKVEQGVGGR